MFPPHSLFRACRAPRLTLPAAAPAPAGKTSLIKALAQHTKRSIISVPLSKISTNQELMDIVFDSKLTVQNSSDSAVSLPFHKTIFVMEDVDAASNGEARVARMCVFDTCAVPRSRDGLL